MADKKQCVCLWEEDVLPLIHDIKNTIKVDSNIQTTLEEVVMKVESDIAYNKNYNYRLKGLIGILNDKSYSQFLLSKLSEKDFAKIKSLSEKLNTLIKITSYEFEKEEIQEESNLKKERLTNPTVSVEDIYKKGKKQKDRLFV